MNSWEDSIFSPMSIGGENELSGVNSWEEMEAAAEAAAATAGGMLMGLFLGCWMAPSAWTPGNKCTSPHTIDRNNAILVGQDRVDEEVKGRISHGGQDSDKSCG
jgi:hypothetical protein